MMNDISVLIGGKAGDGINRAGMTIARMFAACGYRLYMYYDYPSLIRGGHNFSIIRATPNKIGTHHSTVDFLLALDQNTIRTHADRCTGNTVTIYNADTVRAEGTGVPIDTITKEEGGIPIMTNSCLMGAFCGAAGIGWDTVETVLRKEIPREIEKNLAIAKRGYELVPPERGVPRIRQEILPIISGNEAICLGLLHGGLDAYVAYPMTPSSSALHFLAAHAEDFSLKVVHPESEIAVMLMAQGFAYAGLRTAVGTSGGGFCLMTEGLSMAGMTETPVTVFVSQRGGPSTGTPTYTAQGDLHFILHAGHGEFPRFIFAPGDAEQAFEWSVRAINLSWKYQVPSFILADKSLSEGIYSFEKAVLEPIPQETPPEWNGELPYRRYADTPTGVSPLVPVPTENAVVKVNSYAHDEDGFTTELPERVSWLHEKKLRKVPRMQEEIDSIPSMLIEGTLDSGVALLCWGSNLGVCWEAADDLGLGIIQPIVLSPFPKNQCTAALRGVETLISVEDNSTGQLASLLAHEGFRVDNTILRYDGRPFSLEELEAKISEVVA